MRAIRKALNLQLGTLDDGMWFPPYRTVGVSNEENEDADAEFAIHVESAYRTNGIVFACIQARMLPFTEARFQFQDITGGRPGKLFGTQALSILERPWTNGTTGDLLARMEQDSSLGGNFFAAITGRGDERRLRRLRPDWVTVVTGLRDEPDANTLASDIDAEVVSYIYHPPKGEIVLLSPERVVHYAPIPDPLAHWRGMSWLTPIAREIQSDTATTKHKQKFFTNGATPPFVIQYDSSISPENFQRFVAEFKAQHTGTDNAYKVLHLGGGAEPATIGTNLQQLDFKAVQGAGETRIAAASGVGAIIARLSEGMQGSTLSQGNYHAAKRQFADMTLRPLWRMASGALESVIDVPDGSRLWTDTRDVAFLADDSKDEAEILGRDAATIRVLIEAGFKPAEAVDAVTSGDLALVRNSHTGLSSVQLTAPATTDSALGGDDNA